MRKLSKLLFSMIACTLTGYLPGMVIGFTVFDPNLDVYTLLGAELAIRVVIVSANITTGILLGFYVGTLLAILLWEKPVIDDLLTVRQHRHKFGLRSDKSLAAPSVLALTPLVSCFHR